MWFKDSAIFNELKGLGDGALIEISAKLWEFY